MDTTEFDEIRPYNDEELPQIFEELIADPAFQKAATDAIPNVPFELLAQKIRACKSKLDFQETFCYGILWKIAADHTDGLTLDHTAVPVAFFFVLYDLGVGYRAVSVGQAVHNRHAQDVGQGYRHFVVGFVDDAAVGGVSFGDDIHERRFEPVGGGIER